MFTRVVSTFVFEVSVWNVCSCVRVSSVSSIVVCCVCLLVKCILRTDVRCLSTAVAVI